MRNGFNRERGCKFCYRRVAVYSTKCRLAAINMSIGRLAKSVTAEKTTQTNVIIIYNIVKMVYVTFDRNKKAIIITYRRNFVYIIIIIIIMYVVSLSVRDRIIIIPSGTVVE